MYHTIALATAETTLPEAPHPLHFDYTLPTIIVSFLIVCWALAKFAWPVLFNMLEKRRQGVADLLDKTERNSLEAERLLQQHQEEMRRAHQDAQALIEKATKAAEQRTSEILEQARTEADKIKNAALAQIEVERTQAIAEIRNQVSDLSVAVAEKILRKNLDAAGQKTMIDQFIQEVEAGG